MNDPKYAYPYPHPRLDAPPEFPSGSTDLGGFPASNSTQEHLGTQVPPPSDSMIQILDHSDASAATTTEPSKSVVQAPPPPPLVDAPPEPVIPRNAQQQDQDLGLGKLVVAFCLTAAFEIAFRSVQTREHYPITFQLLSLLMVFALAFLVVAKYIVANYPTPGRLLEHAGLLCGVTAFFVAITVSFPLCLKIISWIVYALSLLAISICNCPPP